MPPLSHPALSRLQLLPIRRAHLEAFCPGPPQIWGWLWVEKVLLHHYLVDNK